MNFLSIVFVSCFLFFSYQDKFVYVPKKKKEKKKGNLQQGMSSLSACCKLSSFFPLLGYVLIRLPLSWDFGFRRNLRNPKFFII